MATSKPFLVYEVNATDLPSLGQVLWTAFSHERSLCSRELCMWGWPAEVRAGVLGCEELPCARPDVSHRDRPRAPTSTYFSGYKMPTDFTWGARPTPTQPIRLVTSPISSANHRHPELTLPCLWAFQSSHITHRSKLISRVGDFRIFLLKYLFLLI